MEEKIFEEKIKAMEEKLKTIESLVSPENIYCVRHIDGAGRLSLPVNLRDYAGIGCNSDVEIKVIYNGLLIQPVAHK